MRFVGNSFWTGGLLSIFAAYAVAEDAATPSPVTGSLGVTSNYTFRGISQTQNKPAVQGGLTYTHSSGFHGGFWGSNVNFKPKDSVVVVNDNASLEFDITAGYGGKISDALTWDVSVTHYGYPGSNPSGAFQYDFWEVSPSLVYDFGSAKVTAQLAYSPDFFGPAKHGTYLMAQLDVPLPSDFAINAHLGEQWLQADNASGLSQTFVNAVTSYVPKNYTEWKLGISKQVAGVGLELAYFGTDISQNKCQAFQGQHDLCKSTVVLTVSKSF